MNSSIGVTGGLQKLESPEIAAQTGAQILADLCADLRTACRRAVRAGPRIQLTTREVTRCLLS